MSVSVSPADILALFARLVFVILLYAVVAAVLLSLRRSIRATEAAGVSTRAGTGEALRLTVASAPEGDGPAGRAMTFDRPVLIGRRPDCDVVVTDDSVSGHHAHITWNGTEWRVEDLGSRNGTYVNERRIEHAVPLRVGDAVRTGHVTWHVEQPA